MITTRRCISELEATKNLTWCLKLHILMITDIAELCRLFEGNFCGL